ncbi:hypothetical protein EXIGLDRAFT_155390 [Exidia glandulosa HHB12029]|uniref:Uncharacterized protein n=1 Tax=Exidia glandulosa HHB12029 TaxID=1314781 RepID=A0A165QIN2_EXIGL|nr:hypothetical protein EXIGLDRAFT_155390 [Exidia glandulosa HHB12029]
MRRSDLATLARDIGHIKCSTTPCWRTQDALSSSDRHVFLPSLHDEACDGPMRVQTSTSSLPDLARNVDIIAFTRRGWFLVFAVVLAFEARFDRH